MQALIGQRSAVLAVRCAQQEELAIDRIAECVAAHFRESSDRIEKEFFAFVRVLQAPVLAAIGCFVDTGLLTLTAGHHIGRCGVESYDAAKVERVSTGQLQAGPRLTLVNRTQNYSF